MAEESDGIPRVVPQDYTGPMSSHDRIHRLEWALKGIDGQLRQGSSTMADLRSRGDKHAEETRGRFDKMQEEVQPRLTPMRILGWIVGFLMVVGLPIASALWTAAKYPDRSEYRDLEREVRQLERDLLEMKYRTISIPLPKATP